MVVSIVERVKEAVTNALLYDFNKAVGLRFFFVNIIIIGK